MIRLLDTQALFELLKLPYPTTRDAVIARLESERLITSRGRLHGITNLAAVLFAKKLGEFDTLWRKAARVIIFDGTNKLKTKLERPATMGYAVGFVGLIDFINTHTKTNEVIEKALRHQVKMLPEIAIRELVANALIHQDFDETGTSVTVDIYDDRIVIGNPGVPFISPDRFIDSYQSRNERLADLMRRLGICEEKGSGIDQVIKSAEVFQLPAPLFEVGERRTNVTLFAHQEFEEMNISDRVRACFQHCVLRYVSNQKMTNQSLRERFKLPAGKAERVSSIIRETIDKGYVKLDDPSNTSKRYAKHVPSWA